MSLSFLLTHFLSATSAGAQILKISPIAYSNTEMNPCHAAPNESQCSEFIPITLTGGNTVQTVDVQYESEYASCRIEAAFVKRNSNLKSADIIDTKVVSGVTAGVQTLTLAGTTLRPGNEYGLQIRIDGKKCVVHDLKVYY